jgi:hypothetical protein
MAYNTTDDCTARPIKVVLLDEWMGHGDAAGWKHDDAAGGKSGAGYWVERWDCVTDGMDGITMTLLAGRAVLDTVMADGTAGW